MRAILKNYSGRLRTEEAEGIALDLPAPGKVFRLICKSLTPEGHYREITTSTVRAISEVERGKVYWFKTLNSIYELEVLSEQNEGND